jgi:murein DD-endopeptidase MepM/ murein hydrolase activator NlpD
VAIEPGSEHADKPRRDSIPLIDVRLDAESPPTGGPPTEPHTTVENEGSPEHTVSPPRTVAPQGSPPPEPLKRPRWLDSPRATAIVGAAAGLLIIGTVIGAVLYGDRDRRRAGRAALEPALSATAATSAPSEAPSAVAPTAPAETVGNAPAAPPPGPWRVTALSDDPSMRLVNGTLDRRSFLDAAASAGIPRAEIFRAVAALRPIHNLDHPHRGDSFTAALDRESRKLRAFEYVVSPTEMYQLREQQGRGLTGERVDMHIEQHRRGVSIAIGDDWKASVKGAGLDPAIFELLDEALAGRLALSALRSGARLRLVAVEETSFGVFSKYAGLAAVEYTQANDDTPSLRLYHFEGKRDRGYFDAKGKKPFRGGFRSPIPGARISSGFNLHRMHPVLHIIKPHNGVDFAASAGTPVYAAYRGTVVAVGPSGPSGNLVLIDHGNGFTTGYAHLSRFAEGLRAGQKVDTRQLVGYVGSTGRSTGPHLHFSTRKNGQFIDPMRLKMDGEQLIAKADRSAFEEFRATLDRELDEIPAARAEIAHDHAAAKEAEPEDDLEPLDDQTVDAGP